MSAPESRVSRHESELGSWELVARDPDPRLREHVASYCGYVERGEHPLRRREMPTGEIVVILSFGPAIDVSDPARAGAAVRRTSFVAGLDGEHSITEHDGVQHGLQLNLTPLGAFAFFGSPPGELAGRVVDLEDLLGPHAPLLVERLHEAPDWEVRFALLDELMSKRLADHLPASPDVTWAWRRLRETDGRLPIGELIAELRCSRRHLTTRFREQIGLSPKALARILRFERGVRRLRSEGGGSLADIARQCGYYDQAHFNRDFREFAGWTPTEFVARLRPDGGGASAA